MKSHCFLELFICISPSFVISNLFYISFACCSYYNYVLQLWEPYAVYCHYWYIDCCLTYGSVPRESPTFSTISPIVTTSSTDIALSITNEYNRLSAHFTRYILVLHSKCTHVHLSIPLMRLVHFLSHLIWLTFQMTTKSELYWRLLTIDRRSTWWCIVDLCSSISVHEHTIITSSCSYHRVQQIDRTIQLVCTFLTIRS